MRKVAAVRFARDQRKRGVRSGTESAISWKLVFPSYLPCCTLGAGQASFAVRSTVSSGYERSQEYGDQPPKGRGDGWIIVIFLAAAVLFAWWASV